MGQNLSEFIEERSGKYRLLAEQSRDAALNAQEPAAVEMHMAMAKVWETLALELEHLDQMGSAKSETAPLSHTIFTRTK